MFVVRVGGVVFVVGVGGCGVWWELGGMVFVMGVGGCGVCGGNWGGWFL